jgi:hypothetical protein
MGLPPLISQPLVPLVGERGPDSKDSDELNDG